MQGPGKPYAHPGHQNVAHRCLELQTRTNVEPWLSVAGPENRLSMGSDPVRLSKVGNHAKSNRRKKRRRPVVRDQREELMIRNSLTSLEGLHGKIRAVLVTEMKARQSMKIREIGQALIAAGFFTLDEQTKALGVPRSTAWTILQARHKNYGLSEKLIKRMLASQHLPPLVRSKIIEYHEEKTAGLYGGPQHSEPDLPQASDRAYGGSPARRKVA